MTPEFDISYYPERAQHWIREHQDILDIVAGEFRNSGTWPAVSKLTRELARAGQPVPLAEVLFQMPRALGYVSHNPDQVVLFLPALQLTLPGQILIDGYVAILRLAYGRYTGDADRPMITRADVVAHGGDPAYEMALSEILRREAPFLAHNSDSSSEEWTLDVTDDIVRYREVETPDDYLRIRGAELAGNPQTGWRQHQPVEPEVEHLDPTTKESTPPVRPPESQRYVFISHASEDKAEVARPLAQLLGEAGWNAWLDELELEVGDSLNLRLNAALARSRFGVVILSRAFFSKHWPKQELNALAAKEAASGTKVILPVWHGIDAVYLTEVAPMLADRLGVATEDGIDQVAARLVRALERAQQASPEPDRAEPVVQSIRASAGAQGGPPSPSNHARSTSDADPTPITAVLAVQRNIEDLRHRVMDAIEADPAFYWLDLLASDVFERYEQTLMLHHPDIFSEVADAYRAAHAINQRVPQARLGTPIPATEIPWLRGKVDREMRHASELLRGKIPRRSDQDP